jgi:autoinducer 2-degrading protein
MFTVWVTVQVKTEHRAEFLEAIATSAAQSVALETGCLGFDVIELQGRTDAFAFCETYADEAAFLVDHRASAHLAAWRTVAARVLVPGSQVVVTGNTVISQR